MDKVQKNSFTHYNAPSSKNFKLLPLEFPCIRLVIIQGTGSIARKALKQRNIKTYPVEFMIIMKIKLTKVI
jgi:hypothetical protein